MAQGEPMKIVEVNIDGNRAAAGPRTPPTGPAPFRVLLVDQRLRNVGKTAITEDTPLRPTSVYGASKVAGEQTGPGFSPPNMGSAALALRIGRGLRTLQGGEIATSPR